MKKLLVLTIILIAGNSNAIAFQSRKGHQGNRAQISRTFILMVKLGANSAGKELTTQLKRHRVSAQMLFIGGRSVYVLSVVDMSKVRKLFSVMPKSVQSQIDWK